MYMKVLLENADGIRMPAANADRLHESLEKTKKFVSISYPSANVQETIQNAPVGAIVNIEGNHSESAATGKYGSCGVVMQNHELYSGSYKGMTGEKIGGFVKQGRYGEEMHVTLGNDASVSPKVAEMIIREAEARKERESAALAAAKDKGNEK